MGLFGKRVVDAEQQGKPTPEKPKEVVFGDLGREGIIYIPEDITDGNSDVTETANTGANTDENWIKLTNGANVARFFRKGVSKMLIFVATSTPTQITTGELVFVLENNDASRSRQVHRMDLATFDTLSNQRNQLYQLTFPFNLALAPNYVLRLKIKSASTLATAQSTMSLREIIKATNVTLEDFKKFYADWLLV